MSGTVIKLKYSDITNQPASDSLVHSEPAYSFLSDRLFIGKTDGVTVDPIVIGGKYFTDMMDHTLGTLTASSSILVDANKHISEIIAGGLTLTTSGGTAQKVTSIETTMPETATNAQLLSASAVKTYIDGVVLDANENADITIGADVGADSTVTFLTDVFTVSGGTGLTTTVSGTDITVALDNTAVTAGSYGSASAIPTFTVDAQGRLTAAGTVSVATNLSLSGDTGTDVVSLLDDTLAVVGGTGLSTAVTDNTVTVNLNDTAVTAGSYGSSSAIPTFTVDAQGRLTAAGTVSVATLLNIAGDVGTDTINLLSETLAVTGGEGISVSVANNTISIDGTDASAVNKGIAAFSSADFDIDVNTVVSIKDGAITNAYLANPSFTIGATNISLGSTTTSLTGMSELTVDNLNFNGNEISSLDANGNISLNPAGTGTVDVNGARISGLGEPVSSTDAATKNYVDTAAEGLAVKPAVKAATTADLGGSYDNGTDGVGATITISATATLDIDGVTSWSQYDGVLVKDQTNPAENGRYYIETVGGALVDWRLMRCSKCDEPSEIPSSYVFVQEGNTYDSTGWVATVDTLPLTVGTDDITWTQFSGAGTYLDGEGLSLSGSTFNVNVAAAGGIEISADALQLKSSVAGNGLSYADGVITAVGTTNRIVVSESGIDIASNYTGQTSIVTLGTIETGTWAASPITPAYGGLGITSFSAGDIIYATGANTLVKLSSGGAGAEGKVLQVDANGLPVWGIIDGGTF